MNLIFLAGLTESLNTDNDWNVRFATDDFEREGLLEVQRNGVWGPVCGFGLGWQQAVVICQQLGFIGGEAGTAVTLAEVKAFTGVLRCTGIESSLGECPQSEDPWGACGTQAYIYCGTNNYALPLIYLILY